MSASQTNEASVRFAELLAALSLVIDLGLGQPMEKFQRTCLLAVRLGKLLGASSVDLVALYYLSLIQHLGCTAYANDAAAIFGDDIEANTWFITTDLGNPSDMLAALLQHVGKEEAGLRRVCRLMQVLMTMPRKTEEVFRTCLRAVL